MEVIVPMEPVRADTVPDGREWVAQVKWDGVRVLTYAQDPSVVRLFNRHGRERTAQYPELLDIRSYCRRTPVVLDGEVIALGPTGTPDFHEVMRRDRVRRLERIPGLVNTVPIAYMVFDILFWQGKWIASWPLRERQELLQSVLSPHATVHCVETEVQGNALYRAIEQRGMEGVVCKRLDSVYRIGQKHGDWRKVKVYRDATAVIGGFTVDDSGSPNALLLGLYDSTSQLRFIGQAGPGKLTAAEWSGLVKRLRDNAVAASPFLPNQRIRRANWSRPTQTVKVLYREWTRDGHLWQPTVQSLTATDVTACIWDRDGPAAT